MKKIKNKSLSFCTAQLTNIRILQEGKPTEKLKKGKEKKRKEKRGRCQCFNFIYCRTETLMKKSSHGEYFRMLVDSKQCTMEHENHGIGKMCRS